MKECEHNFIAEKYIEREVKRDGFGNTILKQERVKIFCSKCGLIKS